MGPTESTNGSRVSTALVDLLYELLDAHDDTARLVRAEDCGEAWEAHLDYLRSLQRVGREMLAGSTREKLNQATERRAATNPSTSSSVVSHAHIQRTSTAGSS